MALAQGGWMKPLKTVVKLPGTSGAAVLALATSVMLVLAPSAFADPAADPGSLPPDPGVPSSPPASATFPGGWTLTVSADQETQLALPPMTVVDPTSHDVIVGGVFRGSLRNQGSKAPATGSLEVGYQIGCLPGSGMMAGMLGSLKHNFATIPVIKKQFTGSDPVVEVAGYRLQVDQCSGQPTVRSYAILSRAGDTAESVIAYYGVPKAVPATPPSATA